MSPEMKKDVQTAVRLDAEILAKAQVAAADFKQTPASLLRALLEEFVAAHAEHGRNVKWPPVFVHVTATSNETEGGKGGGLTMPTRRTARTSRASGAGILYPAGEE
jgi:hypothetical protein